MIILEAKFERIKKLGTKTNIILSTKQEINPIQLQQATKAEGFFAFSPDQIKKEVEEAMRDHKIGINEDGRTKSQILRGAIWKLAGEIGRDGEEYYIEMMDKIINHIKSKSH